MAPSEESRLKAAEQIGGIAATLDSVARTVDSINAKVDTLTVRTAEQELYLQEHNVRISKIETKLDVSGTLVKWGVFSGAGLAGLGAVIWHFLQ